MEKIIEAIENPKAMFIARILDNILVYAQLCFFILKITKTIAWSWWFVLSPLLFTIFIWVIGGIFALIVAKWVENKYDQN